MKKLMLIGVLAILVFLITFEVFAGDNTDYPSAIYKTKEKFCYSMAELVSTGKMLELEPSQEDKNGTKSYTLIDLDKDDIYDEILLSCGSSGECGLEITLTSSGKKLWLNEDLMFYLIQIGSDIYAPVITGEKEDFLNEGSTLGNGFYLREKHLAKLYKLTANNAVLVCQF